MKCPFCSTENREDRETCYHCGKDISMLRLVVNRARHHYNVALEHAERQRYPQALSELEHCLELDHSFVPAHVVMGTVYAKMEQFDEAEPCWETALGLDPHIIKAHEYIDKSHVARRAVALLQRLRWIAGAAVVVVVVFAALIVWQIRPTSDMAELKRICTEIEEGDYDAALAGARVLERSAHRREVRQAARTLVFAIGERYESAAMTMLGFLLENKPVEAHEFYRGIVRNHAPPEPYRRQLDSLDRKVAEQAVALVDSWQREFDAGVLPYEEVAQRSERIRRVFEKGEVVERTDRMLASVRRAWVARTLDGIPASSLSTSQTLAWLDRLGTLRAQFPEHGDAVASATQQLTARALTQIERQVEEALRANAPDALGAAVADLKRLAAFGSTEAIDLVVEKAVVGMRGLETERLLDRLRNAKVDDIPQVDGWIASYEKAAGTSVASVAVAGEETTRTRRRLALEMLTWCTERDQRFERQQIGEDEARWTVERAEFVLRYIKAKSWRYTRDNVMLYTAIAWIRLGNVQEALRWFERLEKSYPKSDYIPLARRIRGGIANLPNDGIPSP